MGDIGVGSAGAGGLALGVAFHDTAAVQNPFPIARLAAQAMFAGVAGGLAFQVGLERCDDLGVVLGVDELFPCLEGGSYFILFVAEHGSPALAINDIIREEVPVPEAVTGALEDLFHAVGAIGVAGLGGGGGGGGRVERLDDEGEERLELDLEGEVEVVDGLGGELEPGEGLGMEGEWYDSEATEPRLLEGGCVGAPGQFL